VAVLDDDDRVVGRGRVPNDLEAVLQALEPHRAALCGVVVESTYNWYWLVDGLMDAGYRLHLANPAAIQRYKGLKYSDDSTDAAWLAHLLRLGLLPEGHIYPKETRGSRDLLRRRSQLVRCRTAQILAIETQLARSTGRRFGGNLIKRMDAQELRQLVGEPDLALAITSNLEVMRCLYRQIAKIEKAVLARVRLEPAFVALKTTPGIGDVLGLTIALETGNIGRFAKVGNYASYCRCVGSEWLSNGKRKGRGNTKNGNKWLAWAYVEAAHFTVRFSPEAKRYYQRKTAKTKRIVAIKAVAHKLARACFYVMRDGTPFDPKRCFG
jgi:transposase